VNVGALAALGAALCWAATNLILRGTIVTLGGATAQAWRTVVGVLVFAPVFLALRPPRALLAVPPRTVGVLLLAVLLSMVIGDILQFTAVRHLGVALTLPLASAYPLLTVPLAVATLGEVPSVRLVFGALLVVAGVVLVALPRAAPVSAGVAPTTAGTNHRAGVALALGSAVCVAAATALTRAALRDVDILSANMLRLPFSAVLCTAISAVQRRRPPWQAERRNVLPLCLAGLTGLGSTLCYLAALQLVGASTTATLNAAGPIFGLLGAVVFLRERPTCRSVAGTVVACLGIVLVV
jgi:drug/metabolite transporter (DMT)-like permease